MIAPKVLSSVSCRFVVQGQLGEFRPQQINFGGASGSVRCPTAQQLRLFQRFGRSRRRNSEPSPTLGTKLDRLVRSLRGDAVG
jgi:hypothetical protein